MEQLGTEIGILITFIVSVISAIKAHMTTKNIKRNGGDTNNIGDVAFRVEKAVLAIKEDVEEMNAWLTLTHEIPAGIGTVEPVIMWKGDGEGNNTWENEAYRKFFGVHGRDLDWFQIVDREKSPNYIEDYLGVLSTKSSEEYNRNGIWVFATIPNSTKLESTKVNVRCKILRDSEGKVRGTIGVLFRGIDDNQ